MSEHELKLTLDPVWRDNWSGKCSCGDWSIGESSGKYYIVEDHARHVIEHGRIDEIMGFIERHATSQAEAQTYIVALKGLVGVR